MIKFYLILKKKLIFRHKNRKIGYLFQNYALFPNMTIEENLSIALKNLSKQEKKKLSVMNT